MPSNRVPTAAITVGGSPLPTVSAGGGSDFAALTSHISDPVGAHAGSAISFGGSGAWADGTTNPAADVETQLDKIVTDLATGSGTGKIRYNGSGSNFADATALAAGNLESVLDTLVSNIGSTGVGGGAYKVGVPAITKSDVMIPAGTLQSTLDSLADAGFIQYSAGQGLLLSSPDDGSVQDTIETIMGFLASQTAPTSGARQIGIEARTTWLDTTTNPLGSAFGAIDKIISDLVLQTVNLSGAQKIGIDARPTWLDGLTNPATSAADAIDKIITDLNDQIGSTADGASRVGAAAVGALTVGSVRSQLNQLDTGWGKLDRANTWTNDATFDNSTSSFIGDAEFAAVVDFNTTPFFNATGDTTAAWKQTVAVATIRKLLFEAVIATAKVRFYVNNDAASSEKGWEITANAEWNGTDWTRDNIAIPSSRHYFEHTGLIRVERRDAAAGTFAAFDSGASVKLFPVNPAALASVVKNTVYAKNIPKAWGYAESNASGGFTANQDAFGIATFAINSGNFRITMDKAMSSTNYSPTATVIDVSSGYLAMIGIVSATVFDIRIFDVVANAFVNVGSNAFGISFHVFGEQTP